MMKKLLTLLLFLPLFASAQTIPNGNFESWIWVGFTEHFEFWTSETTEDYDIVSVDLDSYEGDAAMRITAQPTGLSDYGEAYNLFELDAIPAALNFYAKTEVENGGVSVEITFLNQDVELYSEIWFGTSTWEDYTLVSIPLEQIEPVISHAKIKVTAQVGDLVAGTAWISVDAMEFGEPLSVKEKEVESFKIYPNPTSESLTIQSNGSSLGNLKITDSLGKIVIEKKVHEHLTTIDIQGLTPGIYFINSDTENLKASTFIIN